MNEETEQYFQKLDQSLAQHGDSINWLESKVKGILEKQTPLLNPYKRCKDCIEYEIMYDEDDTPVGHKCKIHPKCKRSTRQQQITVLVLDELRQMNNWLQQISDNLWKTR